MLLLFFIDSIRSLQPYSTRGFHRTNKNRSLDLSSTGQDLLIDKTYLFSWPHSLTGPFFFLPVLVPGKYRNVVHISPRVLIKRVSGKEFYNPKQDLPPLHRVLLRCVTAASEQQKEY